MDGDERWIGAATLASMLAVNERTVRRWSKNGLLPPPYRMGVGGRCLRWRMSEVDRFLTSSAQVAGEARGLTG
jgi:predicted DNA-binding transcriptional regulator AlpA